MPIPSITVEQIFTEYPELEMILLCSDKLLKRRIYKSEINRPGLSLTGFFDFFAYDRIQVFGQGEWAYLNSLSEELFINVIDTLFQYELNCIIFTHGNKPDSLFLNKAIERNVPVFTSQIATSKFVTLISTILNMNLAPTTMKHGVLIEVFGIGILLTGKSGLGKSETALELIERGHLLVADDMVEIRKYSESYLMGSCSDILRHHMEIRGLGIINIKDIFGIGAVKDSITIEMIIDIAEPDPESEYDRTGLDEMKEEILGVKIPLINIPIRPGRNIPILVETAAMNQRLKKMGTHTARDFNAKISQLIKSREIERTKT